MSSADVPKIDKRPTALEQKQVSGSAASHAIGPKRDFLGVSFFVFHLCICAYIIFGWTVPFAPALMFYLAFLPLVAMQWLVNRGACVMSNFETLLRTGRWRDPDAAREDRLISAVLFRLIGRPANPANVDVLSFGALFVLWLLGLLHLCALGDPALIALFP